MSSITRSAALAAGLCLASATPGLTASQATRAFLAHVVPNVDFLDRSSRFALENSTNARLRAFAHDEAREQTLAANAIYDWTQAATNPMIASTSLDATPTGSTKPADPAPQSAGPTPADRPLLGQEDLDSLEGLEGPAFDTDYKSKQREALEQVEGDYADYVAMGDDPALLKIAKAELPKIKTRRKALDKI